MILSRPLLLTSLGEEGRRLAPLLQGVAYRNARDHGVLVLHDRFKGLRLHHIRLDHPQPFVAPRNADGLRAAAVTSWPLSSALRIMIRPVPPVAQKMATFI